MQTAGLDRLEGGSRPDRRLGDGFFPPERQGGLGVRLGLGLGRWCLHLGDLGD